MEESYNEGEKHKEEKKSKVDTREEFCFCFKKKRLQSIYVNIWFSDLSGE